MSLHKSILLFLTAILLFALFLPFAVVTSIVMLFVKDTRKKAGPAALFYAIAWSIDLLGNVVFSDLFNIIFIRHGGYRFGEVGETVSSALGVNQINGTLSGAGHRLANLLDRIDPNHCNKAARAYHEKTRVKPY